MTTKQHIKDSHRLKPYKISLPHSIQQADSTICLIVADPQRAYKDLIASEEFPAELRERITRVIDITHLKSKFKQYEAQRKLYSEHDVFVADDRIVNYLPKALGKTFYKSHTKRPIQVTLRKPRPKVEGKRMRSTKEQRDKEKAVANVKSPGAVANAILDVLDSAIVNLSPSTNTAVKVGYASWDPKDLMENVLHVAIHTVEKCVPNQWNNVRSLFVKGVQTAALPIYEAKELWVDAEKDVVADGSEAAKLIEAKKEKSVASKKRKSAGGEDGEEAAGKTERTPKKARTAVVPESNDDKLDQEIAERKERLRKQKSAAKSALEG